MKEKLDINIGEVVKKTLSIQQPAEDLDEALLRACKNLYSDKGMMVFQAFQHLLEGEVKRKGGNREEAFKRLETESVSMTLSSEVKTVVTEISKEISPGMNYSFRKAVGSLDDLPPEIRDEVNKLMEPGSKPSFFQRVKKLFDKG